MHDRPAYADLGEAAIQLASEATSPLERSVFLRNAREHFIMARRLDDASFCDKALENTARGNAAEVTLAPHPTPVHALREYSHRQKRRIQPGWG